MSPEKRLRLLKCVLFSVFLIGFSLVGITDAWKLRDLSHKGDENKLSSSKPQFRDVPMRKIVRVVRVTDDESDDDGVVGADDDDDDDDTDNDSADDFVFEKVHTTHFDLPLKPVAKLSSPDVEQDEDERQDDQENTEKVSSFFEPVFKIQSDILGWFSTVRKAEEAKDENSATEAEVETSSEPISWLSYLNRYPFNIVLDKFLADNDDYDGGRNDSEDQHASDDHKQTDRQALTTENFEELLLSIPSFIPNYTNVADIDCKRMGQIFQRQVRGQKLWALQSMCEILEKFK